MKAAIQKTIRSTSVSSANPSWFAALLYLGTGVGVAISIWLLLRGHAFIVPILVRPLSVVSADGRFRRLPRFTKTPAGLAINKRRGGSLSKRRIRSRAQ